MVLGKLFVKFFRKDFCTAWGAAAFALLFVGCAGHSSVSSPPNRLGQLPQSDVEADRSQYAAFLPNPQLTPGDTLPVTTQDICVPGYTKKVRNVPIQVKRQVYLEYGILHHHPGEYEIDHLISLELGGSNSIRNLWPQSYETQPWNAHVKDQLENELHREVCSGEMDLATAQQDIAKDWIATYKRVFHTQHALSPQEYRNFVRSNSHKRGSFPSLVALPNTVPPPINNSASTQNESGSPNRESDNMKVWVNTRSGKFFFPGSRYYGNTKQGEYLTEQQAIQQGYVPAKGD